MDTTQGNINGDCSIDLKTDSLRIDGTLDVFCIEIDQFWMEFTGVPRSRSRPVPFMESFPVTLWVTMLPKKPKSIDLSESCDTNSSHVGDHVIDKKVVNTADMHAIASIGNKVSIQVNHCQFVFLMRLIDGITGLLEEMEKVKWTFLYSPSSDVFMPFYALILERMIFYDMLGNTCV